MELREDQLLTVRFSPSPPLGEVGRASGRVGAGSLQSLIVNRQYPARVPSPSRLSRPAPPRLPSPLEYSRLSPGRVKFQTTLFILFVCLFFSTGCAMNRSGTTPLPVAFDAPPSLAQVVDTINANSQRVQQLHSSNVQLSIPGKIGRLRAKLDFERSPTPERSPGRFRLGGEALGSRQLDLGSNDEQYWMWVKQNKPPTVFWGRHSEFYRSAAQQLLPVPPSFIVDAMGIVTIDPRSVTHDQPYASETPGLLQIRTRIPTPNGDLTRVFEVDQQRAVIVQQQIYDPSLRLLAVADASNFTFDPLSGISLPQTIKIQLPPANLAFDFEVDGYTINQPVDGSLWSMPKMDGHQYLDLASPEAMQGLSMMGNASQQDFYDSRASVTKPVRPEVPRAARRFLPSMNLFR